MANVVGARPTEVAVMGTLTNNIHNLLASFYRPDRSGKGRRKIIIEGKAFPSDHVCPPPPPYYYYYYRWWWYWCKSCC